MDEDKDDGQGSLSARLRASWLAGDATGFHCLLYRHVLPRLCRDLRDRFGLDLTDAEECVALAFDGFRNATTNGTTVAEPYAYIRASAHNAGITLHRRRGAEVATLIDYYASADGREPAEIAAAKMAVARWAAEAVEETLDDVEADESWAVTLIEAAMETLPEQSRTILKYLSERPFDLARGDLEASSQQAAADLGLTSAAFRKAKERAYSRLREAIRATVADLGLLLPPRFAETILPEQFIVAADEGQ